MDSPVTSPDETPRVKFLCSFGGSILPRPQDGKLRYVGGETRIVSLPREINYEELMLRMKELFEGANLLKYQQPDEDLDALVSVVNDDDVTNMMEEYDKLGSGDGFTRLRMFLFSHPDHDSSSVAHFDTGDDRETERRYVDALNSLNESPEFRRQQSPDSPVADQFFNNPVNIEFGIHNQRNCEVPLPQFNLRQLTIPHLGSGQHQIETPWSPAYYSPRHHGHHDPRPITEYPSSPSSSRYRVAAFGELPDQQVNHQPPPYEHQSPFVENVVWLPPGAIPVDKGGFPGNLSNPQNVVEGNSICDHCRMSFQRNQNLPESARYSDSRWKQPHLEPPPNMGNEFHQFSNPCVQCTHSRETYVLNTEARMDHGVYPKEQNEPQTFYSDAHNHERGWAMHHQLSNRGDEPRTHISGAGRLNEHYVVDGTGLNFPPLHVNCGDGHQTSSNCINHEDPRYIRSGHELGNEVFHDQAVRSQIHVPVPEDRGVRYGNIPAVYGTENLYQVSHGPAPAPAPAPTPALWIKVQNPLHSVPSYEALNMLPQGNGTVSSYVRGVQDSSPSFHNGLDNQNPWVAPQQMIFGFDGSVAPEYLHGYAPKLNLNTLGQENQHPFAQDPVCSAPDMLDFAIPAESVPQGYLPSVVTDERILASTSSHYSPGSINVTCTGGPVTREEKSILEEGSAMTSLEKVEDFGMQNNSSSDKNEVDKEDKEADFDSNGLLPILEGVENMKLGETDDRTTIDHEELSVKRLSFLPELIASVKKAALEGAEEVKAIVQGEVEGDVDPSANEAASKELESVNVHDVEVGSDSDHKNISKIEPTKAEEEALARGLQTIRNDDLEEIRELGSGTYGAVFHGKWKGSDVAIKRIKASCFAGRPSERERLIADFWKEALILSSLHHPNVVSFYGIVRDGPDGSLATVTEFMVNGSLKQFIQKKDRTIDRRKRLIIAMDAAFGMEYLHGKNIVHFDLKCENLLVNMRDPHRPVCKIGDLGLSKVKQHTLVSGGVRGTLPWMAPELLSGKSNMVTEKIDVYSFGIVMWELLTGEEPYADMHCASLIGGIVHNSLRPEVPSWCDPEWKSLMESCWASEPGERPSFSEISQRLRKMSAAINVK
ncbi:Phox/Bem1p [Macleaya cordata]|uniref:Phox/Bem1p n=1 Tax=Macleaya cordata TaxID=56857 RepID=A0A200R0W8_MACCD|nr:Phox/Bem1p [Macleaya cordata]